MPYKYVHTYNTCLRNANIFTQKHFILAACEITQIMFLQQHMSEHSLVHRPKHTQHLMRMSEEGVVLTGSLTSAGWQWGTSCLGGKPKSLKFKRR